MPEKKYKLNNKGMSMMEIIVIIAMVSILVGIATVGISAYRTGTEQATAKGEAKAVYLATQVAIIDDYQNNSNYIPNQVFTNDPIKLSDDGDPAAVAILENAGLADLVSGEILVLSRKSVTTDTYNTQIETFEYMDSSGKFKVVINPKATEPEDQIVISDI